MIVYLATNLINKKQYVGYTSKSLSDRIKVHFAKAKSKTQKHYFYLFPIAIRKYGCDNFEFTILKTCKNSKEAQQYEKHYIQKLNTIAPNGYNLTEGGNGGVPSNKTKEKISKSVKKYWDNNKEKHPWYDVDPKTKKAWVKKAWETKNENGYIHPTGHTHSINSKLSMSETKNEKNKVWWLNVITKEKIELSPKKMAEYTKLSVGVFNHLKNGRQVKTKCGWTYLGK